MNSGQTTITDISDGKITGADVSFCVVHTFNDNTVTNKYSGTLANGVIKGKMEFKKTLASQSKTQIRSEICSSSRDSGLFLSYCQQKKPAGACGITRTSNMSAETPTK